MAAMADRNMVFSRITLEIAQPLKAACPICGIRALLQHPRQLRKASERLDLLRNLCDLMTVL
jgi:hypothetical protein